MSGNSSPGNGSIKILDIFILGFAFFATYFGAGNLIFPPQLGLNSGSAVFAGLSGLTLSGIFLPIFDCSNYSLPFLKSLRSIFLTYY